MDMGRSGNRFFLEAAGVGLDAGLFGYFDRLESGGSRVGVLRAVARFLRRLGSPRITVETGAFSSTCCSLPEDGRRTASYRRAAGGIRHLRLGGRWS